MTRAVRDPLSDVPLLGELPIDARAAMLAVSEQIGLRSGDWLFRQGEPADSCFVVLSGRLQVLSTPAEGGGPRVMRVERRGAVLGELSLLAGGERSASVRAARDSELLRIDAGCFAALLEDHAAALALVRELAKRLRASTGLAQRPAPPEVVALVTAGGRSKILPIVNDLLYGALDRLSRTTRVRTGELDGKEERLGALVQGAENAGRRILLEADLAEDPQSTEACLRQADQVIAVVDATSASATVPALAGCELLIVGSAAGGRERAWIDAIEPRSVHVATSDDAVASWAARMARVLCARSVGIVLSGGGARGFAHIGALQELEHAGVRIDRVGGCSMGAFVGALFATGLSAAEIRSVCEREFVDANPLNDYTMPTVSVVRGQKARRMLERSLGSRRIEQLDRDYFCVSCDLLGAELIVHRHGSLVGCVGASMNLPGILPPIARDGRMLVDGGVLDNLPVATMAERAEGPVIGVDVTARFGTPAGGAPSGRWSFRHRRRGAGPGPPLPSVKETLTRSIGIGSVAAVSEARRVADLLILPDTGSVGMLEFEAIDRMIEAGRAATLHALAAAPLPHWALA